MPVTDIANTAVDFPFAPYDCQRKFMTCVIGALDNSSNAALESPTGTGKTLSLLCSSLGWLEKYKSNYRSVLPCTPKKGAAAKEDNSQVFPSVIYASRTHSQLQQVVRELNKTRYKYMKVCTLASREQLCVNERVKKEENTQIKGQMCRNLVRAHKCNFYNTLEKDLPAVDEMYKKECVDVPDIEDLVNVATKFKHCPYFRTQNLLETADLILLPYNYVFDPKVRQAMKVKLKGNILIIDEAHNLESTCEDSISIEWSSKDTALCIDEAKKVLTMLIADDEAEREQADNSNVTFDHLNERDLKKALDLRQRITQPDVAHLLERLMRLEEKIDELGDAKLEEAIKVAGLNGVVYQGEKMVKLLEESEFIRTQRDAVLNVIDLIGMFLAKQAGENAGLWAERGTKLAEFGSLISRVFADSFEIPDPYTPISKTSPNEACKQFLMYVDKEGDNSKIKYWCFSASTAMKLVASRGVRSIIVASGTLSPMPSFLASLGIPFQFTLENEHVAKKSQIVVGALKCGPNNISLVGSYQNRSNNSYIGEMGLTLLQTMQATPQGMLVFFSSYAQMNAMIKSLKELSYAGFDFWTLLGKCKKLFVEPKSKMELPGLLTDFSETIASGKGAAFFAVCRGKISEGIDLPDSHCRAVFMCGIPYSPPYDPRVVLKKHFLQLKQAKKDGTACLSPDEWYKLEALKAVNQAIGRVIRHQDDFGIVVLADARFAVVQQSHLSAWLRPSFAVFSDTKPFFDICERFFRERNVLVEKSNLKLKLNVAAAVEAGPGKTRQLEKRTSQRCQEEDVISVNSLNELYGSSQSQDSVEILPTPSRSSQPSGLNRTKQRIKVAATSGFINSDYFKNSASQRTLPQPPSNPGSISKQTSFFTQRPAKSTPTKTSSTGIKRAATADDLQRGVIKKPLLAERDSNKVDPFVDYRQKINNLPADLKKLVLSAQRKYVMTGNLGDVVPALEKVFTIDPVIMTGFREFVLDDQKKRFDAMCEGMRRV